MVPSSPLGSSAGSAGVWGASSKKWLDEWTEGGRRQREQELQVTRTCRRQRSWRQGPPAGLWVDTPEDAVTFIQWLKHRKETKLFWGAGGGEGGSHLPSFRTIFLLLGFSFTI